MVSILHFTMMVNKIDRPNTTPTVRGIICTLQCHIVRRFVIFLLKMSPTNSSATCYLKTIVKINEKISMTKNKILIYKVI